MHTLEPVEKFEVQEIDILTVYIKSYTNILSVCRKVFCVLVFTTQVFTRVPTLIIMIPPTYTFLVSIFLSLGVYACIDKGSLGDSYR